MRGLVIPAASTPTIRIGASGSGQFQSTATIKVSATASGGSVGQVATLDVKVAGEDAQLASSDVDYQVQMASVGGVPRRPSACPDQSETPSRRQYGRTGGSSGSAGLQKLAVQTGILCAMMMKDKIAHAAERGWQSGRCVQLKVSASPGPTGLDQRTERNPGRFTEPASQPQASHPKHLQAVGSQAGPLRDTPSPGWTSSWGELSLDAPGL
jgi:hypothetical protein